MGADASVRLIGSAAFLVAFALVALLTPMDGPAALDEGVTTLLRASASSGMDAAMRALTNLGGTIVLLAVTGLGVVLVRTRRPEALFLVLAVIGSLLLNDVLKELFHRPRPRLDWAEIVPEYSFPSGHAMNSFVVYVALAVVVWRIRGRRAGLLALGLAIALSIGIGISRVYLGVHHVTDVVAGVLAGALWLLLLATLAFRSVPRPPDSSPETEAADGVGRSAARIGVLRRDDPQHARADLERDRRGP